MPIRFPSHDPIQLLISSFRYYLGRRTIAAGQFPQEYLKPYWHILHKSSRAQIKDAIRTETVSEHFDEITKDNWIEVLGFED